MYRILLSFNIGFTFCIQFSRWMLGSLATHGFEILTGKLLQNFYHDRIYWPLFLLINFCIILIGSMTLYIKKYKAYKANSNMVQQIHIGLENQNNISNINVNNQIYNMSVLNSYEVSGILIIAVVIFTIFTSLTFANLHNELTLHHTTLVTEILAEYFFSVILPFYIIMRKNRIKSFLLHEIQNIMLL